MAERAHAASTEGNGSGRSGALFAPLARETLSAQIRDRILEQILSGELPPNARVPSERALSEQFQVARTSVREAMQGLLSLGVIERRGNRSHVAERLPELNVDRLDDRKEFVRQLFETRRALELPIIELAAERATPGQRAEITELAAGFRAGMSLTAFREQDRAFHTAIARACGNPLLVEMYGKVLDRLFRSPSIEAMLSDEANRREVDRIVAESAQLHVSIATAIERAEPEMAVSAARQHLGAVESGMIDRLV